MQVIKIPTTHVWFHAACNYFAAVSHVEATEFDIAVKKQFRVEGLIDRLFHALDLVQIIFDDVEVVESTLVDKFCYFGSVAVANVTVVFLLVGHRPCGCYRATFAFHPERLLKGRCHWHDAPQTH